MTAPSQAPIQAPLDYFTDIVEAAPSTQQYLTSPIFKTLRTDLSPTFFVPAEIVDETQGLYESIRIVGGTGTETAIVQRGAEGTDPVQWNTSATVHCSPRVRDVMQAFTDATKVPPDLHVGSEYARLDEGVVRKQTLKQGALPLAHCEPGDMKAGLFAGASLPAGTELQLLPLVIGPIYTSSVGAIDIAWDGLGSSTNYWSWNKNLKTRFQQVTGIFVTGYLTGSDSSWLGDVTAAVGGGQSCAVRCKTPSGAWFANRLVKLSLLVVGV